MPDIEDQLSRYAEAAAAEVTPVTAEHVRSGRRLPPRWRRGRTLWLAAAALLLVAVPATALLVSDDDEPAVVTGDEQEGTTAVEPPVEQLRVEPSTGLRPDQVVEVTGPFDPTAVAGVAVCAAEAAGADDPLVWCDLNVARSVEERNGAPTLLVTVVRFIQTSEGLIDCSERPGRCVIGVRAGRDFTAPISFADDLPPAPEPTLELDRPAVADGGAVELSGTGFSPGEELYVSQCKGTIDDPIFETEESFVRCDQAHSLRTSAAPDGSLNLDLLAFAEILTYEGWTRCDPCVLRVAGFRQQSGLVAIDVDLDGPAIRPSVTIEPAGPYRPGRRVTLRGAGFQASAPDLTIGWCRFTSGDPSTEISGDPSGGYAACAFPTEGFGLVVTPAGQFTIEDYPLPDTAFADACLRGEARCGLSWHPMEGSLPVFVTLFELEG